MIYPVCFVSLGPGDPDLITLKGLKQLQSADLIYCPATQSKEGVFQSRSKQLLEELQITRPVALFHVPMDKDRNKAQQVYKELSDAILQEQGLGKRIVLVAEGDAGFYSSIHYVMDYLQQHNVLMERVAGVPAFIAAGVLANLHIVKQEEQLHVIPGKTSKEELCFLLQRQYTIVIMKLSQASDLIKEMRPELSEMDWFYFENIGCDNQIHLTDKEVILARNFPYFSLLIIKPQVKEAI